jgi:hypothetical protein
MASWSHGQRPGDTFEQGGWRHARSYLDRPQGPQPARYAWVFLLAVGFLLTLAALAVSAHI